MKINYFLKIPRNTASCTLISAVELKYYAFISGEYICLKYLLFNITRQLIRIMKIISTNIYKYNNYRRFLNDSINELNGRKISQRTILLSVNIRSANFFTDILRGVNDKKNNKKKGRNITLFQAFKFADYFGLDSNEKEYLLNCINYTHITEELLEQNKTTLKKAVKNSRIINDFKDYQKNFLSQMIRLRPLKKKPQIKSLKSEEASDYYAHWSIPAVRELLRYHPHFGNRSYDERALLAQKFLLDLNINTENVSDAVKTLESLNYITKNETGDYCNATRESLLFQNKSPENSNKCSKVHPFVAYNLDLAAKVLAIDAKLLDPELRVFKTAIINISEMTYEAITILLKDCFLRILQIARDDTGNPDRVYSVGMQFFPLTKIPPKRPS